MTDPVNAWDTLRTVASILALPIAILSLWRTLIVDLRDRRRTLNKEKARLLIEASRLVEDARRLKSGWITHYQKLRSLSGPSFPPNVTKAQSLVEKAERILEELEDGDWKRKKPRGQILEDLLVKIEDISHRIKDAQLTLKSSTDLLIKNNDLNKEIMEVYELSDKHSKKR